MLRFISYSLIVFLLISFWGHSQSPVEIDLNDEIVNPKTYVIHKASQPIEIDGKANENDWRSAPFTSSFIDIEGIKTPKYRTRVKMLWDTTYLYVYAKLEENHIWGTLKKRDTVIFYNNDFEVFIDPSNDTYNYGEIEINALGTVWDLYLDKPYRSNGKADNEWNLNDLKTAIHIEGTLNNSSDIDSFWTIEMAIPLKPLAALKDSLKTIPENGEQWRINFSRVQWDFDLIKGKYYRKKTGETYHPEYNWVWSNQKIINMHEPEKWGYVQFSDVPVSEEDYFIEKDDVLLRQITFALFRKISFDTPDGLSNVNSGEIIKIQPILAKNSNQFNAHFKKTPLGFDLKVKNTKTGSVYSINENGFFKILK